MTVDRSLIERFHRVLVEEIRAQAPRYLSSPFTVAEIYQSLVPYRTHRDRIGVELNGDYEEALLHLLAGEGDYLELESEPARRRLQREAEAQNPDTAIFREFAAVDVRLNPKKVPEKDTPELRLEVDTPDPPAPAGPRAEEGPKSSARAAKGGGGPSAGSGPKGTPEASGAAASPLEAVPDQGRGDAERLPSRGERKAGASKSTAGGDDVPGDCPECSTALPPREGLRFCPWCGENVHVVPCGECGEVLDRDWAFCIACGSPSAA
ncbi:MAG: zinc ribbon domain-containing protein [Gemmatimonadales bacterium]|nr:MAG: zinc ribbon domain-containing protein [Gemmatimonadales bacterium]